MDSARFDDLLRILASGLSRRATLAALANGFTGAGVLALVDDEAEARKKRKNKNKNKNKNKSKKRKCKSGTKKCGKKCIPNSACRGACPGDKLGGAQCGESGDCGAGQTCVDGNCTCPSPNDIVCGPFCCNALTDICEFGNTTDTCLNTGDGACVQTDFCNDSTFYACANGGQPGETCVCVTTTDPSPGFACVPFQSTQQPASCAPCETSVDCPDLEFCIPGNTSAPGYCGCNNNFCVPVCPDPPA